MRPFEIAIALIVYVAVLGAAYAYPSLHASSVASARKEAIAECRATVREYRELQSRRERTPDKIVEDAFRCDREILSRR